MTERDRTPISRATAEQTGSEPEVAGHAWKGQYDADRKGVTPAQSPEVEGHGSCRWGASEGDDDGTEVEGHTIKWHAVPTESGHATDADDDGAEVAGHSVKYPAVPTEQPTTAGGGAEVEGHLPKAG